MRRSRMALALGLGLLVLGGLSGCSDDPVPKIAPSESPSVSESPSPSGPAEPVMPAAAKKPGAAGAEAFVDFWFEALSFAMTTGDATQVSSLSTHDCASCSALINKITGVYKKGGSIESRGWSVELAVQDQMSSMSRPTFLLRVRQDRRALYDENHQVVDRTAMTEVPMRAELIRTDGDWHVKTLEIVQ